MASSLGSKVQQLIVATAALGSAALLTVDAIRDQQGADIQGTAIFTEDIFLVTAENTTPAINLDTQPALTWQADGDVQLGSGDLVFDADRNAQPLLIDGTKTFHGTDRVAFSAPSGNPNQYIASAVNPFSGSGAFNGRLLCVGTPNGLNVDVTVSTSATATGSTTLDDNIGVHTGATIALGTGGVIVPQDQRVTIATVSGSDISRQNPDCDLIPYWIEY